MKLFTDLIENLTYAKDPASKSKILARYFESEASSHNKDEALRLLFGLYPKKMISSKQLSAWAGDFVNLPTWLIHRSEAEVGNFIQAFNLLLRTNSADYESKNLSEWLFDIVHLKKQNTETINKFILNELTKAETRQRLILLKLITGTFKSPVSNIELVQAFSKILKIVKENLSLRIYECMQKRPFSFDTIKQKIEQENLKIPFEFPEIKTIDQQSITDDIIHNWETFGKKDGIEAQFVKYHDSIHLWTRNGEIVSDKFPEIISSINKSEHDCKIYGQIIPDNPEIPILKLSTRINKKSLTKNDLSEAPASFEIWEVLDGSEKRMNEDRFYQSKLKFKESVAYSSKKQLLDQHKTCRNQGFAGLLFQRKNESPYLFWKADSFSMSAILMYVEYGGFGSPGIRSLTFGLFQNNELVPVTKISEFDKNLDIDEIIQFAKVNTIEKFGPVRTLKPQLVYEIYFDGISKSARRKSGLILSNPKINKKIGYDTGVAHTLEYLKSLASTE